MTVAEVLQITVDLLGSIPVPRNLNQSIGIPIDNAIGNLNACIEAITKREEDETDGNPDAE